MTSGLSKCQVKAGAHGEGEERTTQFYGEKAIFSITPTTEAVCRRLGAVLHHPEPVSRWELALPEARTSATDPWVDYDPDEEDGDFGDPADGEDEL